jgi:parvulin-like peptidyl-prolyl isomerase
VVDSQTKAESLHKKLKKGEDFLTLAKKHSTSEDPTKVIKGLDLNDLPDAMKVKLQGLAEGDISEPVAASGGLYFLFKVQSRKVKEGSGGEFERIKPRLTQEYKSKELVSATHTWLEENRKNSNIKIIVKTKS